MNNELNEIGGYFELELNRKKELYPNAIKLNSARNCLKYIIMAQKPKKLYMPYYMDKSMIEESLRELVEYEFYNINEQFEIPDHIVVKKGEKIFYNNYYSLMDKYIEHLADKYSEKLIVDNTHSFFTKPLTGIDTIYSLGSKYFGVPGGGYLFTKTIINKPFVRDHSFDKMKHILGRCDKSANEFFEDFQKSKKGRNNQPIKYMSDLSKTILSSIDYEKSKLKRERNFYYLHSFLKDYNGLEMDITKMRGPFVYPFLINVKNLHEYLWSKNIFVPRFWEEILDYPGSNDFEKYLSINLLPLPIDQRYDIPDMDIIIKEILGQIT